MLDREVIKEFLQEKFKERNWKLPRGVKWSDLVEAFSKYTEDDYYEWIKDNFKSFFDYGKPDWGWIKSKIAEVKTQNWLGINRLKLKLERKG